MRAYYESPAQAQSKYIQFINDNIQQALLKSKQAGKRRSHSAESCQLLKQAVFSLGRAYHSYSDSLSPAHTGFQPWYGLDGGVGPELLDGFGAWSVYLQMHHEKETMDKYIDMKGPVVESVRGRFQDALERILTP